MSKIESNATQKSVSEPSLSELPHKDGVLELKRSDSAIDVIYHAFEAGFGKTYQATFGGVLNEDMYPWIYVCVVAALVGVVEYVMAAFLAWMLPLKLSWLDNTMSRYGLIAFVFTNIGISVGLVAASAFFVAVFSPSAGGSGIPAVIAYLSNGLLTGDQQHLSLKTVLVKIVSVVLAISGGLAIGREGPAIHIGASIADCTHNAIDKILSKVTGKEIPFDGNVKHNMVMLGGAAGFAGAFRAPIGGILYCTEEISTHWNIKEHMNVGCQIFVAVALAAFTTNSLMRVSQDSGSISFSSIVIFSDEEAAANAGEVWRYKDIPGFLAVAVLSGLLGGALTRASIFLKTWREKHPWLQTWYMQVLDASFIAAITAIILSIVPFLYLSCRGNDDDISGRRLAGGGSTRRYVQYTCEDGYFSEIASLSLSGEEGVIRHLMSRDNTRFHIPELLIFLVFYIPVLLMPMGLKVPCGSFVPNLLVGSLIGRIVGEICGVITNGGVVSHTISSPGVYALIGASAMLGAWTRTMIAVVVTLIEVSGDVGLSVPLIIAVIIARQISIRISHHSYTHEAYYRLVDDTVEEEGFKTLHPSDWTEPTSPVARKYRNRSPSDFRREENEAKALELVSARVPTHQLVHQALTEGNAEAESEKTEIDITDGLVDKAGYSAISPV